MNSIRVTALIIMAVLAAASLPLHSFIITSSVCLGAALVIASYELMLILIGAMFGERKRPLIVFILIALLKFLLIGAFLWYVLSRLSINVLAFMAGLSTMVLAITAQGILCLIKGQTACKE